MLLQGWPGPLLAPSSQASPGSTLPSPQAGSTIVVASVVVGLEVALSDTEVGGIPVVSLVVGVVSGPPLLEATTPLEPDDPSVALAEPAVSFPPHAGINEATSNVRATRSSLERPITHHPLAVTITAVGRYANPRTAPNYGVWRRGSTSALADQARRGRAGQQARART
jgi:hypothetical protein